MKITHKQMKAARAMLDWSRAELAVVSGISEPNILRLEAGGDARPETMRKLIDAFENHGIVFNNNGGVDPARPGIRTYYNIQGLQDFFDDVYNVVKAAGGDVVITGFDEKQFEDVLGEEFDKMHMDRMQKLGNFNMKCLIAEGDTNYSASGYCEYRWTRKDQFKPVQFYIYGNKVAFIQFDLPINSPMIIVIEAKAMADAFRKHFEDMWKLAKLPQEDKKHAAH